jgi:hypothetical protein
MGITLQLEVLQFADFFAVEISQQDILHFSLTYELGSEILITSVAPRSLKVWQK